MSMTIERDRIEQILDAVGGLDLTENYSGRGMYGETCLAFHGNVNLMEFGVIAGDVLGLEAAFRLSQRFKTDSLGNGSVVYFPGVTIEDEDEDQEVA